jgi:PAS domain S-box-containing protein
VTGRERALNVAKRMNNDLITERQRLSCIIEGTHVGTWEWNVQTGETSFNDYWANIIGYELSELEPISIESWMKFVHPDDAKLSGALLEKHFSGELAYYECEARMRHKNGHWVWVLDRGKVATWTPDGKPLLMSGTHQEITERKQAEVNLQRESEKNLALLRNASDGIHILDYDGNVVEVSDSFCNMLGYSRDQVIGMNVSSWDAGFVNSDELLMLVRKQFENPVRSQFDRLHRRKDGSIFEVEISGYPLELDGHKVLFNSSRDITSRKQIESHLLLHSNILENVAEGVFLIRSADSTIVFSNPQFDQMFGYLKGELIGQHVSVVNAPTEKSPEEVTETINKALRNHGEWHGEVHSRRKDGNVFWTHASVSTFNHSDFGQVWVAVQDDITERKLAENALYIAATAFESQEGMFVTDANSNILRVNQAFTKITGYSAEEVIGKTPRILKSGQHDKDFYITLWESVHNAGGWTGEIWNKRKNGEVYPEFLTITAVKGATGITTNYVATLTDITLRKQAEAAVQQSKEVAEQALTEQSRFLHMLTHELKTPLSVLRMALDIVNPKNSIKLHINLALEDINGIVERSAQMDLLEQRQLVVRPESCDIAAMLSLKKSSSLTPNRFSITLAPLPIVNSDIQLLRIIFSNLINNAIKYSALKTIIEIDAIPSEQQGKLGVLIRIQNQPGASGLPNSEKVFDKYYRSPGAYGMTGSGLGLYLVRSFIELLGGSVACDVVQEKVRFTLWIPC